MGAACGGAGSNDGARPPTPVLVVNQEITVPGVPGATHRWVEGGTMATGDGGIPMPADMPATAVDAGAPLHLLSAPEAEVLHWRIVGLVSGLWPGPSDEAVILADSTASEDGPTTGICFAAPGRGDWMIQVRLDYNNGRGYGNFFWHLRIG